MACIFKVERNPIISANGRASPYPRGRVPRRCRLHERRSMSHQDNYYSWQLELFEWSKAIGEANNGRPVIADPNAPPPKMSNLLKFVRLARNTPEVWNRFVALNDKLLGGEITQHDIDNGNCSESSEAVLLCNQFDTWFRVKNGLEDSALPYGKAVRILKEMASVGGELSDEAIKARFRGPFPIEEDI